MSRARKRAKDAPTFVAAILLRVTPTQAKEVAGRFECARLLYNACLRADEPAELLAYWLNKYGRAVPRGIKTGLADAAKRLYTERAVLKWDSKDRQVRMGDVIEVCHPTPDTPEQASLFRYLLDLRHRGKEAWDIEVPRDTTDGGHFP